MLLIIQEYIRRQVFKHSLSNYLGRPQNRHQQPTGTLVCKCPKNRLLWILLNIVKHRLHVWTGAWDWGLERQNVPVFVSAPGAGVLEALCLHLSRIRLLCKWRGLADNRGLVKSLTSRAAQSWHRDNHLIAVIIIRSSFLIPANFGVCLEIIYTGHMESRDIPSDKGLVCSERPIMAYSQGMQWDLLTLESGNE